MRPGPAIILLAVVAAASLVPACSSAPRKKKPTSAEVVQRNYALGEQMADEIAPHLVLRRDADVEKYLATIAGELIAQEGALNPYPPAIRVVRDAGKRWKSYAVPGNRIYLSLGRLKEAEFEIEIAAEIALQLAHLQQEHLFSRVERMARGLPPTPDPKAPVPEASPSPTVAMTEIPEDLDWFGPKGALAFSEEQRGEAAEKAVGILYHAGFDPRGLITILNRFASRPEHSPDAPRTLETMLERSRRAIAEVAPLRDPVVQTPEFLVMKKRIQRL